MTRCIHVLGLSLVLLGGCGLVGCENQTHHTRDVKVDDDKVKTTDTKVRQTDEGTRIEKKVTEKEYDDGKVKTEVRTEVQTLPKNR